MRFLLVLLMAVCFASCSGSKNNEVVGDAADHPAKPLKYGLEIENYDVEYEGCNQIGCSECSFLEDCYHVARQKEDSGWARLINYGGYDTEEEFWEHLLD